jgi:hypothetical protein
VAMVRALGPDSLTILMPPVPAGDATAAMVESSITTNTHPLASWMVGSERIFSPKLISESSEFLLGIVLLTDG